MPAGAAPQIDQPARPPKSFVKSALVGPEQRVIGKVGVFLGGQARRVRVFPERRVDAFGQSPGRRNPREIHRSRFRCRDRRAHLPRVPSRTRPARSNNNADDPLDALSLRPRPTNSLDFRARAHGRLCACLGFAVRQFASASDLNSFINIKRGLRWVVLAPRSRWSRHYSSVCHHQFVSGDRVRSGMRRPTSVPPRGSVRERTVSA